MTVRRDLDALARRSLIKKVYSDEGLSAEACDALSNLVGELILADPNEVPA